MKLEFISRTLKYNGSMEFKKLNDEEIVANYQHHYVIDRFTEDFKNKKVLDAGCWTEPLEKGLVEKKIRTDLVGIDENRNALAVAQRNFPKFKFEKCQLMSANMDFIRRNKNKYDTIIFLDVIEHLPKNEEGKAFKTFHKLLKKNGNIIISTMSSHPFNFIDPAWFFGHRHYRLAKLRKILISNGFDFEKVYQIGNLWWDIDLLFSYFYKHIFHKKYGTSDRMYRRIIRGLKKTSIPTRYYIKAKKL